MARSNDATVSLPFLLYEILMFSTLRFDDKFLDMAIYRSNANYGALDPETTNVIYVHGSIDPWHALGLTTSIDSRMPAIYIEGRFF